MRNLPLVLLILMVIFRQFSNFHSYKNGDHIRISGTVFSITSLAINRNACCLDVFNYQNEKSHRIFRSHYNKNTSSRFTRMYPDKGLHLIKSYCDGKIDTAECNFDGLLNIHNNLSGDCFDLFKTSETIEKIYLGIIDLFFRGKNTNEQINTSILTCIPIVLTPYFLHAAMNPNASGPVS